MRRLASRGAEVLSRCFIGPGGATSYKDQLSRGVAARIRLSGTVVYYSLSWYPTFCTDPA